MEHLNPVSKKRFVWPTVIAALGGLAASGVSAASNSATNTRNVQLAGQSNAWSLQQWNRENAYNSPVAQMARLRQAGINPNLAYTNGVDNLAGASPAVTPTQSVQPFKMDNPVDPQTMLIDAQRRNLDAQTDATKKQAGLSEVQADWYTGQIKVGESVVLLNQALTNLHDEERNKITAEVRRLGKEVDVMNENINLIRARIANLNQDTSSKSIYTFWYGKEADSRIQQMQASIRQMDASTRFTDEQCRLYGALTTAQIANYEATTEYYKSLKGLTDEQIKEVAQRAKNLKIEYDGRLSWESRYYEKYGDQLSALTLSTSALQAINTYGDILKKGYDYHPFRRGRSMVPLMDYAEYYFKPIRKK